MYSVVARYHSYSGNLNYKYSIEDCFNTKTIIPSIRFPSFLENFSKNTQNPTVLSSDYFINKCTLLPIYVPFLPKDRRDLIISIMKYENGGSRINYILGRPSEGIQNNGLKYCPLCVKEDYYKYNESYFHRTHQIDGIEVCSKHECFLKDYKPKKNATKYGLINLDYNDVDFNIEYENDDFLRKWYVKIAKSFDYLFSCDLYKFDNTKIYKMYFNYIDSMGFTTPSKFIKQRILIDHFINFYGEKLLDNLNCSINKDSYKNWVSKLACKPKNVIHPLKHILFINYLSDSIESFFENEFNYHAFGKDPWPCLNIAAPHYLKDVIDKCTISYDYTSKRVLGTFECDCGFIYSRNGPDKTFEDRYKATSIKAFGDTWEQKLIELIKEEKYSIKELSSKMNCNTNTVVRYARKLSADIKIHSKMIIKENKGRSGNYTNYKNEILDFIKQNPNLNRTEIRYLMAKQYSWIYKYDKEWFMKNMPERIPMTDVDNKSANRVDWNERDIQTCNGIKKEYEKIMSSEKPIRISKTLLSKEAGCSSLIQNAINKLPNTKKLLEEVCEDIETFQKRRIKYAAKQLQNKQGSFKRWELIRDASIKKASEAYLYAFIDEVLNEFNNIQSYGDKCSSIKL